MNRLISNRISSSTPNRDKKLFSKSVSLNSKYHNFNSNYTKVNLIFDNEKNKKINNFSNNSKDRISTEYVLNNDSATKRKKE